MKGTLRIRVVNKDGRIVEATDVVMTKQTLHVTYPFDDAPPHFRWDERLIYASWRQGMPPFITNASTIGECWALEEQHYKAHEKS